MPKILSQTSHVFSLLQHGNFAKSRNVRVRVILATLLGSGEPCSMRLAHGVKRPARLMKCFGLISSAVRP
jgi:hypothetical protein